MKLSLEQKRDLVFDALRRKYSGGLSECPPFWIVATFDESVVVQKGGGSGELYRVPYTIDGDSVSLGDEVEVAVTYSPVADTDKASEGFLLAALRVSEGVEADGSRWSCVLIEEGVTRNRTRYRREVLEAAVGLYEGVPVVIDHKEPASRSASDVVGFISGAGGALIESRNGGTKKFAVTGTLNVTDPGLRARLLESSRLGRPGLYGLSHEAIPERVKLVALPGGAVRDVDGIKLVEAVAVVAHPSAGGRVERLVAGNGAESVRSQEDLRMFEQMLAALRAKRPALVEAMGPNPTEAQVREAYEGLLDASPTPAPAPPATPPASPIRESIGGIPAEEASTFLRTYLIDKAFEGRSMPAKLATRVRESLMKRPTLTLAEAVAEVESWRETVAESADRVVGSGLGIQMGAASEDKLLEALDGFWFGRGLKRTGGEPARRTDTYAFSSESGGVQPFRSFREAYVQITGDAGMTQLVSEQVGLRRFARLNESIQSSDWTQILGDSVRRAMLADYSSPDSYLGDWRKIVSLVTPAADFRTMRRMRMGGYGDLPTVTEGQPYQPFASSPGDEEATYSISKKGALERITWEATVNDDVSAIRRIPSKLSRAAKRTLYKGVFDLLRTNATCSYDSVALAAAGHGNNITTGALSQSEVTTMRRVMAEQTEYGSTDPLNLYPKTLVVPAELEEMAWRLTKLSNVVTSGQASTEQAFQRHAGPNEYIVVPYWTDATDWWGVADPNDIPTIEVGFFQGREEPELLVQDDQRNGSMYSSDVISMKIRHVWGVCLLEHRGFYGGYGVS